MKVNKWFGLAATFSVTLLGANLLAQTATTAEITDRAQPAGSANLSTGAAEVVRLAGGGVGDDVVTAYVLNAQTPFNLSADDVLYLKDVGVSAAVISAMLNRDTALRNEAPSTASTETNSPAPAAPEMAGEETTFVKNAPADVSYFYENLSPYGVWADLAGVGWCWQPRAAVVNRSWRPYCDSGHWLYTDGGWFWQSDYSWGWAPFHYGRWSMHERAGWVWVPDRVWGPSWVVWRSAGDQCGWAPLPPRTVPDPRSGWRFNGLAVGANFDFGLRPEHFTFVAMHNFAEHDLRAHRLPTSEARNIYQRSTVINHYGYNNRTFINEGIPFNRISMVVAAPIPRATIRDLPAGAHAGPPGQLPSRGSVVYRSELKAPTKPPVIVAQRVDERHPTIQHPPVTAGPIPGATPTQPNTRPPVLGSGRSQGPFYPNQDNRRNQPGGSQTGPGQRGSQPGYPSTGPQNTQPPSGKSGSTYNPGRSGPPSSQPGRSSDQGKQPSRSGPGGFESRSQSGPGPSRPDSGNQPSRSGPGSSESRGQNGPSQSRPDLGNQPSRSGPPSQPSSPPSTGSGAQKRNDKP